MLHPQANPPGRSLDPGSGCDALGAPWPNTVEGRSTARERIAELQRELLAEPSATLTLERWCRRQRIAATPRIRALRLDRSEPEAGDEVRDCLQVAAGELVRYRHVGLTCGDLILAYAENWYVPARLTATMNRRLDRTATPFGKVVALLAFQRRMLSSEMLWPPPDTMADAMAATATDAGPLEAPVHLLRNRAVLIAGPAGQPVAALTETYTRDVLGAPP